MPRTYTQLYYHIVFATKNRTPYLHRELHQELFPFLGGAIRNHGGTAIAINGMSEHVHVLARLRAQPSVAEIVKSIKGSSSHWINDTRRTPEHFAWQEGYAAFSVCPSVLEQTRKYVQNQQRHHRSMSLRDEMTGLLRKHGIDYRESDLDF